jgi:hypothetical protein
MVGKFGIQKSTSTNKTKVVSNKVEPHTGGVIQQMNMYHNGYSSSSESNDSFIFLEEHRVGGFPCDPSRGVRRNLFFEFEASLKEASSSSSSGYHVKTLNLQGVEDDTSGDFFFDTFFNSLTTKEKDDVLKGFESYIMEQHPEIPSDQQKIQ